MASLESSPSGRLLTLEKVSIALGRGKHSYSVLQDFDFFMNSGEVVVIIGDSGSGKSTLLHFLAGLLTPPQRNPFAGGMRPGFIPCERLTGRVLLNGEDVMHWKPQRRPIGLVLQHHSVYEHMSVRENLAFPLRLQGTPRAEIDLQVRSIARELNLEDRLDYQPSKLSGGQIQRVALGKLLLKRPSLALLDEAFAHVDPLVEEQITSRLVAKIRAPSMGEPLQGVMIVTHDISQVLKADRILLFRRLETSVEQQKRGEIIVFSPSSGTTALDAMRKCELPAFKEWCDLVRNTFPHLPSTRS